jgi:pimeloyl-ACP methyl ester carboxylesterase
MRRWVAAPLLFAVAVALLMSSDAPKALAQAKAAPPEEETFLTADGIQLHGLFHKSTKTPGTDPVVILLYAPGKDNNMLKGDWVGLANRLTEAGYNVFRFDWRGHGKSNDIKDTGKFWQNPFTGPWNRAYIAGANKKPIKDTFFYKDLTNPTAYAPVILTDLAAVRAHLDSKNDATDVNTSSIYLIGSETAATVGLAWLAIEWNRPAFYPTPNQLGFAPRYDYVPQQLRGDFDTGGADVSGAVWLSPARPTTISPAVVKSFVSGILPNGLRMPIAPKIRDNNPMLFMFGAGDKKGAEQAAFFHNEVLVGKGDMKNGLRPLQEKYLFPVKNGGKLVGVDLLGNDEQLGTEKTIMEFLTTIQQGRKQITRKPRGYNGPYFIKLDAFGIIPMNNP